MHADRLRLATGSALSAQAEPLLAQFSYICADLCTVCLLLHTVLLCAGWPRGARRPPVAAYSTSRAPPGATTATNVLPADLCTACPPARCTATRRTAD